MKVQRKKRGDWNGKSEKGFYVVHPARRMRRTRMEIPLLRTRISK